MNLLFDMHAGIAGDMTIGALLDFGADKSKLIAGIKHLNLEGYTLSFEKEIVNGVEGYNFDVFLEENVRWKKRYLKDIKQLLEQSDLSVTVKKNAINMFMILAEAEAKAHKTSMDKIDFHEVGAVDTIIDIVGTSILLEDIAPENIYFTELYDGTGFINYRFGQLPVPVPAVKNIAAKFGLVIHELDESGEHVTPTGASIVANYKNQPLPSDDFRIGKTGYGVGNNVFDSGKGVLKIQELHF